uniref:Probable tRNA pseudouridine synthase B n=1 Tax=uncultured marine group II/III euryarchaeote KM3_83_G03 TaxID=1456522 RepID=A0A075HY09_9EURY|nr:H/ACA RNA-protein complex component (DKC1, NOLA4, CBF5) [uncultured marine group II/III euryarchaeote KM3_83_G03]
MLPFEKRKFEILTKKEEETNSDFGCKPEDRSTEKIINYGIVNLDKPSGPSSHQTSAYVKQILKLDKAGHSGTLDPSVTGILPVALGKGTRITHSLIKAGKEYITLMRLHKDVPEEKIRQVMDQFVGEIKQMVPVRSAVKRRKRQRSIHYLEIIDIKDREVLYKVGTQAGTYIRKLCHDVGERIGCGAHMAELRRTKAGPFTEENLATLQDLKDAYTVWKEEGNEQLLRKIIFPVEYGVTHLQKIWIRDSAVNSICTGATLNIPGISKLESDIEEEDSVAVLTLKGELVCTGIARMNASKIMSSSKGLAVKPHQVIMPPGIYPKFNLR